VYISFRRLYSTTCLTGLSALVLCFNPLTAWANPLGGTVSAGQASLSSSGATLTVDQSSDKAVIDWRSFNIGASDTTIFHQPSSSSMTLNRVNDINPSQIEGSLSANGTVIIVNPNGVVFGKNSHVDVNGLIATTADIDNAQFMKGSLNFNKAGNPDASIVNNGHITAKDAGLVGLVAPTVINNGVITAKLGRVQLSSGDTATVDLYGDDLMEVAVSDKVKQTLVSNTGKIEAAGGSIRMTAAAGGSLVNSLVRVKGELKAPTVGTKGGEIVIGDAGDTVEVAGSVSATGDRAGEAGGAIHVLGDAVTVKSGGVIDASGKAGGGSIRIGGGKQGGEGLYAAKTTTVEAGATIRADATSMGNGGSVVVWSQNHTVEAGSISAAAPVKGDGGSVEVSSRGLLDFIGTVDLAAYDGVNGSLLLDPENITIQTATGSPLLGCTTSSCTATADSSILTVATLQSALASGNVTVSTGSTGSQAGNITLSNALSWTSGDSLTLSAAGAIALNATVSASNGGTLNLVTTSGAVSQTAAITAANLSAQSSGGTFTLTGATNAVGTLAASMGTGKISLNDGSTTLSIGTVNGIAGVSANELDLQSTGTVTQAQAITATNLYMGGAANFTFTNNGNNVGTLAGGSGGTGGTGTYALNNGANNLVIGTVNGSNGFKATQLNLTDTGTVTQTQAITLGSLSVSGSGGTFNLTQNNFVGTIAGSIGSGTLDYNNGNHTILIGTANGINGVTAGTLALTNSAGYGGESQAINVTNLSLYGSSTANYDFSTVANNIGTLAAHTSSGYLYLNNGGNTLSIGTVTGLSSYGGSVTSVSGLNVGTLALSDTGTVTQSQAITATSASFAGSGATYTLSSASNNIGTLAAYIGTGTLTENNGAHNLAIGTVSSINGITAGELDLTDTGTVTQSQAVAATNVSLSGSGSAYTLSNADNNIGTLAANTGSGLGTLTLNNGANNLSLGTVNGVSNIRALNFNLTDTGTVSETTGLIVTNLDLSGAGTFNLNGVTNAVGTLAASVGTGTVAINDGSASLAIGTANGINGVTASLLNIAAVGSVSQSQAITAANFVMSGSGGTFTLSNSGNAIGTVAGNIGTGTLTLNNGANALAIGTINSINGITAGTVNLTDTGAVTQSQAIAATNASFLGSGSTYTLSTANNIGTLAASVGTGTITENNGANALAIGAVNSINGITAGTLNLADTGIVTQSQTITVTNASLSGSGATYTLSTANNIGTLSAGIGAGTLSFYNGTNNLAIGTVNGINGVTAANFYLSDAGGTVSQTQAIAATNLSLFGNGATFALSNASNAIGTLAGNVGTGTITENNGANALAIGTVNSINGITAGTLNLADNGTVTQSQAIAATNASLSGTGATYTLSAANTIGTLAGNVGTGAITENNGANALAIGTVSSINGITAGTLNLMDRGTISETQTIAATNASFQGNGGAYALNSIANDIGMVAINTGTGNVSLNNGSNSLAIGTVNTISGIVSGALALNSTGTVTQAQAITAASLNLTGGGATYTLTNAGNDVASLGTSVGTGTVTYNNGANNLSIGTGAVSTGGTLNLADTGTVTQANSIQYTNLSLSGSGGTYSLLNPGNNSIANLAADVGSAGSVTVNNGATALVIGTVNGISGVTAGTFSLADTGAVTQGQAISAANVALLGGGSYTLSDADNAIGTLAGLTGSLSLADDTALHIGSVAGTDGLSVTGNASLKALGSGNGITFTESVTSSGTLLADAATGNITIAPGATLTANGSGEALTVRAGSYGVAGTATGGDFINNEGADALSTPTSGASYAVYTGDLAGSGTAAGGLSFVNWRYDTASSYNPASAGDAIFYRAAPTLTVAAGSQTSTYGDTPSIAQTYTVTGEVAGNGVSPDTQSAALGGAPILSTAATASSTVADGPFAITIADGTVSNPYNYQLSFINGSLSITPRDVSASFTGSLSKIYGDANPSIDYTDFTFTNLAGSGDASLFTSITPGYGVIGANSNVGTYTGITAAIADTSNYHVTDTPSTSLAITARPLTVTTDNQSKTYGDADPAFTGAVTGLTAYDAALATFTNTPSGYIGNAGSYTIEADESDPQSRLANYTITDVYGTFTVAKKDVTVSFANPLSRVYGDADPALDYTGFTFSALGNGDLDSVFTGITPYYGTIEANTNVGTYAGITAAVADTTNYHITGAAPSTSLTITPRPLTVSTGSGFKLQGMPDPGFTGSAVLTPYDSGLVSWTYAPIGYSGGVGTYTVGATALDPQDRLANYTQMNDDGTFQVIAAAIPDSILRQSQVVGPSPIFTDNAGADSTAIASGQGSSQTSPNFDSGSHPGFRAAGQKPARFYNAMGGLLQIDPELAQKFDLTARE
jgi:filamentous hemagglutinin family protein